jgi:hypothetical protein
MAAQSKERGMKNLVIRSAVYKRVNHRLIITSRYTHTPDNKYLHQTEQNSTHPVPHIHHSPAECSVQTITVAVSMPSVGDEVYTRIIVPLASLRGSLGYLGTSWKGTINIIIIIIIV